MPGASATLRRATAIITASDATRKNIQNRYRHKCIYITENAVDPIRFDIESTQQPKPLIDAAFVGRLVPYKGAEHLIRAAIPFAQKGQLRVHIFGDGPQKRQLIQLVESSQLSDSIKLYGWIDHTELQSHLSRCDVLTFPSIREFGGGVVLEAMAKGVVPVIADYAGPSELVNEQTGFRVPLGKPDELVNSYQIALQRIIDNPHMLQPMRDACINRVKQHFTWDAKARKMLEVYKWALGQRESNPEEDPGFLTYKPPV